ncbi:hypothetical protein AMEX_G13091 [Astyanax mexicanus]|uniref:Uncharacterized protein n=1 Tax=Astyanax mexicanus TaxID=7994 RepID=A0A8T2LS07_ASTMX|nr:hypothetical protein AMEX_G13091 [Astyanax mexicanus]
MKVLGFERVQERTAAFTHRQTNLDVKSAHQRSSCEADRRMIPQIACGKADFLGVCLTLKMKLRLYLQSPGSWTQWTVLWKWTLSPHPKKHRPMPNLQTTAPANHLSIFWTILSQQACQQKWRVMKSTFSQHRCLQTVYHYLNFTAWFSCKCLLPM